MNRSLCILLALLAGPAAMTARSQQADSALAPSSSLTIRTGNDTAWVILDSVRQGRTPLTLDSLRGGRHILQLVQTDISSWLTGTIRDTVWLNPGEGRTLRYTFDRRVLVVTNPSGAVIFMGDSAVGTTPHVLVSGTGGFPSSVTVERKGYARTVIPLPPGSSGIARAELQKIWQSEASDTPLMSETGSSDRIGTRLFVAGGVTVAAGVAAAYFKIKADGKNALYQDTGDPSFQSETRRLDTSAAIALLVTEVGFAFFSYYLLSD
ncbi:MAG TPA: PEGA domain-containing protein [Bacteroidota bacterium]|nr:PEGA domain-containing protein [Bacteroidota bacterium]